MCQHLQDLKMLLGKVAAALLLLACAIGCTYPATATTNPGCITEQKDRILLRCQEFIDNGPGFKMAEPQSPCCLSVRAVVGFDMACIVSLLTEEEKTAHNEQKILILEGVCDTVLASHVRKYVRC